MDNVIKVMSLVKEAYALYGTLTKDEQDRVDQQVDNLNIGVEAVK
jgi:hypothetical protein